MRRSQQNLPMVKRDNRVPRKVAVHQTCKLVAKVLGCRVGATLSETLDMAEDDVPDLLPWDYLMLRLYPWYANVGLEVMRGDPETPLVSFMMSAMDVPYLVVDSGGGGPASLWVVVAEDAFAEGNTAGWLAQLAPVKMLVNHFTFDDGSVSVTAAQLQSCLHTA